MKWVRGIIAAVILISFYSIIGNMEYRIVQQEAAWSESVQAVEMEQENVQSRIAELQKQYEDIEELYVCQGILLDDIRTRLHFEFIDSLEAGEIHE